jgi:ParB-like chromosome segregation protein Spo0J
MDAPAATPPELTPPPPSPGTIELEIHRLDRCYAHLRVTEPEALGRLVCSLSMRGQCHPVVVVQRQGARYALIDGYRRVVALERLCRDTVKALVLGLEEPEALTYCHQRVAADRRSSLEEGWLVAELLGQGRSPAEISAGLDRSLSWVSRRLGLGRALPEKATEAVRRGVVPAHGAMKSLLPLARANRAQCETLCERLGSTRLSTRQLASLYAAWRAGSAEQRERITQAPLLFLEAKRAASRELPDGAAGVVVRLLDGARTALDRAGEGALRAGHLDPSALSSVPVERALGRCTDAYETLVRHLEEPDAG